jgi:glycosyltransferase involved in cell wall biosynthesis
VDVGVPTVGRPGYLEQALDSVLAQTHRDLRLIVSVDGPLTPPLARRLRPYLGDRRVDLRVLGRSRGPVATMNAILDAATAPYIAILHDDDGWEPGFLARRVRFLDAHPACGFVFSGCTVIDGDGAVLGHLRAHLPEGEIPSEVLLPLLIERNRVLTPTVVARRAAYRRVGGFDPAFPALYDYEMWLRLAARFPAGYVRDGDARWRLHGAQATYDPSWLRSEEYERLLRRIDETMPAAARPAAGVRRRNLGLRLLADALNAATAGRPGSAARHLLRALAYSPGAIADPRAAATLAGIALGPLAPRLLPATASRARRLRFRIAAGRS